MITDAEIDRIYIELDTFIIDLESNPSSLGAPYLQDRMATCRNYLNKASLHFTKLSREKAEVGADLRSLEDSYQLDYEARLATDEQVRNLAAVEDRKATVAYGLRDARRKINDTRRNLACVEAALKVVAHRQKELHSTMDILKEQRRLMTTDISTGAMYGDERTRSGGPTGVDEELGAEELEALLSGPSPEKTTQEQETPEQEPAVQEVPKAEASPEIPKAPEGRSEEELIRQFLSSGSTATSTDSGSKSSKEEDFSDFLDNL